MAILRPSSRRRPQCRRHLWGGDLQAFRRLSARPGDVLFWKRHRRSSGTRGYRGLRRFWTVPASLAGRRSACLPGGACATTSWPSSVAPKTSDGRRLGSAIRRGCQYKGWRCSEVPPPEAEPNGAAIRALLCRVQNTRFRWSERVPVFDPIVASFERPNRRRAFRT